MISTRDLHEALEDAGGDDGLFQFEHAHGEDPGLYARAAAPERPLALEDLPDTERAKIAALRLRVDFAQQDVHLADLIEPSRAATWGDVPLRYTDEWRAEQERQMEERQRRSGLQKRNGLLVLVAVFVVAVLYLLARARGLR